jgi:UrcA family protein
MNLCKLSPLLMALCATGVSLTLDAVQAVQADGLRAAKVSTADLDLGTTAGVRTARERVNQAARRLCRQVEDMNDLSRHENYLACVDTAMSAALQQLKVQTPAALADLRPAKLP